MGRRKIASFGRGVFCWEIFFERSLETLGRSNYLYLRLRLA